MSPSLSTVGPVEAIAAVLGVDENDVDIDLEVRLPEDVTELIERLGEARAAQREADHAARDAMRTVARELVGTCALSTRDAGELLGVSHQRISQVVRGS